MKAIILEALRWLTGCVWFAIADGATYRLCYRPSWDFFAAKIGFYVLELTLLLMIIFR